MDQDADMKQVLKNFYYHQLEQIGTEKEKKQALKLFERGLISVTDCRMPLPEWEIKEKIAANPPAMTSSAPTMASPRGRRARRWSRSTRGCTTKESKNASTKGTITPRV